MHKLLAMILGVAALLGFTEAARAQELFEPQMTALMFAVTPSAPIVLPVGVYGTFSCLGSDIDNYGDPLADDEDGVHATWGFGSNCVTDPANTTTTRCNDCEHTQYPMSVQCKWTSSGVKSVTLSVDDEARFGDESPVDSDDDPVDLGPISVTVVEAASISSQNIAGVDRDFTLDGETNPAGYYSLLSWSGGGIPSTGSGQHFTTKWNQPGPHTVTLRCGTSTVEKSVKVIGGDYTTDPSTGELRYYNGALVNDPYYDAKLSAMAGQPQDTTYFWAITQGPFAIITGQYTSECFIKGTGPSAYQGDGWVGLTYTNSGVSFDYFSHTFTCSIPALLVSPPSYSDLPYEDGFRTTALYKIYDQLGRQMIQVPAGETFENDRVDDCSNNWDTPSAGGASLTDLLCDIMSMWGETAWPVALSPPSFPLERVFHHTQNLYVGSSGCDGSGYLLKTVSQQFYRDRGRHE